MLNKPVDGAWQGIESVNKPADGAWQECEAVCKPVDGAWVEIWSAVKYLIEKSSTLDNGTIYIQDKGLKFHFTKSEDYYDGTQYGDLGGTGDIIFYLDGEWTNPTISFDYEGGMSRSNSSGTTWYTATAGSISIYSRTTDGTEKTTQAVDSVGSSADVVDDSYSGTLEGTFDRLGLSIHIAGYSSLTHYYSAMLDLIVSNLKFNDTKIAFPASSEIDYT